MIKMKEMIGWIVENKEWVFSGIGVFVLSLLLYKKEARNYLKAMFNYKSKVTQINIERKEDDEK